MELWPITEDNTVAAINCLSHIEIYLFSNTESQRRSIVERLSDIYYTADSEMVYN